MFGEGIKNRSRSVDSGSGDTLEILARGDIADFYHVIRPRRIIRVIA